MGFNFTLDDMLDFDQPEDSSGLPAAGPINAVLREQGKESALGRTTASDNGYGNQQVSVSNIGSLLMGVPIYKDPKVGVSQQEFLLSGLMGSTLTDDYNKEGKIGSGFDELVPYDIASKAKGINSRKTKDVGSAGSAAQPVVDPNNPSVPATNPAAAGADGYVTYTDPWGSTIKAAPVFADNLHRMQDAAKAAGRRITGKAWRDPAEQVRLYAKNCRNGVCSPPTARPGSSLHERGEAIDFDKLSPTDFSWLQANAKTYNIYNLKSERWHWSINGH